MNRVMFACAALLGLLLGAGGVSAQCTRIIQNGTVQNNTAVTWVAPCVIAQAGPSTGSSGAPIMLSDLGVQGNIGVLSGPITGSYWSSILGWSATTPGEFDINLNGFGGAIPPTMAVLFGGTKVPFPGVGTGNAIMPTAPAIPNGDLVLGGGNFLLKDGGLPISTPTTTVVGDCVFWGNTAGKSLLDKPCIVSSTAALGSLAQTTGASIVVASSSAPPATYLASPSGCIILDGGSCFASSNGGSWVLAPQTIYDIRWWGFSNTSNLQFYADAVNGNDNGGANFCVNASFKCKTMGQVVSSVMSFCAAQQHPVVNLAAGTYNPIVINGVPPCNGGQFPGGAAGYIDFVGVGATTIITDPCTPSCLLYNVETAQGASIRIGNLEVSIPSGDDGIFVSGVGSTVTINSGVTLLGQSGALAAIHVEGQGRVLQAKSASFTVTGSFTSIANNTYNSNATFAGTVTCTGSPTFSANTLLAASQSSTYFLNFSNFATCPNTVAPYKLIGNSFAQLGSASFPTGGTALPILVAKSTTDQQYTPCYGSAGGCAVVTAPTGWGSGATFAVSTTSTAWNGQVNITAGTGPSTSGTIWLSIPVFLQTISGTATQCLANVGDTSGGTAFPSGTTAWVDAMNSVGGTNIRINFQGTTAPTNANVYSLNYVCGD